MKLEEVNTRTKEAVDFLVAALESGHSEVLTAYLGAMAKFHTYSFGNIMLIARQKPDATNVAGLRTWNSLGRFVKRGEKGIFILAPMVGRRSTKDVATDEPSEDATTEGQRTLYGFRAVYVFDVTQTEGKDLPSLTEVNGDVSGYRERLFKFVEAQSVEISFSEKNCSREGSLVWREDHAAFRDAARRGVFHDLCMKSPTYVAQRVMWRSLWKALRDGRLVQRMTT